MPRQNFEPSDIYKKQIVRTDIDHKGSLKQLWFSDGSYLQLSTERGDDQYSDIVKAEFIQSQEQ